MRRQLTGLIIAVLGVAILAGATIKLVLPSVKAALLDEKRIQAQNLTDVAAGTLQAFYLQEKDGRLSRAQAQAQARERIRSLRYGVGGRDYFWIINREPVMIMHPYRPELEGWDLTGYNDEAGNALFMQMVDRIRRDGAGFVQYFWQWRDDPTRQAHKLSYVQEFKPWGWIIGTGVYLDDLEAETAALGRKLTRIGLAVVAGLLIIFTFIFLRNVKSDRLRAQAEKKLQETADLYHTVLQTAPNAIAVYDREDRTRYLNKAFENTFGWKMDQLTREQGNFVPPHCRQETDRAHKAAAAQPGQTISYQSQRFNAQGELLDVEINEATFTDASGNLDGLVVNLKDITAAKKAEQELADYRNLLETVVDELPFWISLKDNEGRYVIVNQKLLRDHNLERDDLIGWTTSQVQQFQPGSKEEMSARDRLVIVTGQRLEVAEYPASSINGRHWRRLVKMPWRSEKGGMLGVISWSEDITEHKNSRDRLRQYQRIVDTSSDLQALVDSESRYLMVNQAFAQAFNLSIPQMLGRTVSEVVGEKFYRENLKDRAEACLKGQTVSFSLWVEPPNLGRRFFNTIYYPYFDQDGRVSGYVINTRDMTENRNLEMQLRHSQKIEAIGTLAGGIAHDFNNILAAIMGYTELALGDLEANHPVVPGLRRVLASSERAKRLVQQILSFSRKRELELKPVDLATIITEGLEMLRSTLPVTIDLEQHLKPGLGPVLADSGQIHQVVMNLVTNAAQALGETGRIQIALDRQEILPGPGSDYPDMKPGPYLRMTVRDNGPGIHPGAIDRIFEPFFTTKEQGQGTGMGLSVAHGIVESHQGQLSVQSKPGQGAVFTVLLPMAEGAEPAPAQEVQPTEEGAPACSILFVDDEPALRDMMSKMLTRKGFEVTGADCAQQALNLLNDAERRFDLVITDQTMPGMTGLELAKELKSFRPDLPIILCSGAVTQGLLEKAALAGIDHLAAKPINSAELTGQIKKLMAG